MSKKSRRRNKKILGALALIGGLGLAARNKRNASIQANEAKESGFDIPAVVTTPKKKPAKVYQDAIMRGDKGTKFKQPPIRFSQVINKKGEVQTLKPFENSGLTLGVSKRKKDMDTYKGYATKTGNSRGDFGLTKKPQKKDYFGATIFPKSQAADNYAADIREYGRGNEYKSGGRAKLRSGGKVKGCGIAKRGLGRAMKKGRK